MTATVSPAVTQATTAYNQLSQYYTALANYLQTGTSYPNASDYLSSLDYSELYTIADLNQKGSSNYASGALIETIHHIIAVQRELGMTQLTKAQHYQNGGTDGTNEAEFYTSLSSQYGFLLSGLGDSSSGS